jgi:hypothetical protein
MRSFIADEPFEPVERLQPGPAAGPIPERLQRFWPKGGRLTPAASRVMMGAGSVALILFTWQSFRVDGLFGAMAIGLFALVWSAAFIVTEVRTHRDGRIAALMHERSSPVPSDETKQPTPSARAPAEHAPPVRLDVYLQEELTALLKLYLTPVGADLNIIGLPPRRILYLYNFFSAETLVQKVKGNWRRFGPVYFLGSPGDFSYSHTFDWRIGDSVAASILATPEVFDTRLASVTDTVLPPGDSNLTDVSYFSGGYPQHLFLCNDGSWRHGVSRLFDHAEVVLLDACGYDVKRAGLNWEIGQLIDRVATHNFVVLIDEQTDQTALCAAFRAAWLSMERGSPNNRADASPVRWVLLETRREPGQRPEQPQGLPSEADPLGLYSKFNPLLRTLIAGHYRDALIDDRIFGLLIEA